jgi:WD40 repeat protein
LSVGFSPDGHHIVSGSEDKTVRIWNADTGKQIGDALTGHTDPVCSVGFSPDGHHIVSGSSDKTVRIWNADTGKQIGDALTGHTDWVRSLGSLPDGQCIVSSSDTQTVNLNADTVGQIEAALTWPQANSLTPAVRSYNTHCLVSDSDNSMRQISNTTFAQETSSASLQNLGLQLVSSHFFIFSLIIEIFIAL